MSDRGGATKELRSFAENATRGKDNESHRSANPKSAPTSAAQSFIDSQRTVPCESSRSSDSFSLTRIFVSSFTLSA